MNNLLKNYILKFLKSKFTLSLGYLLEIGQNIFFEKITDNIATTVSTFLSTIIGIKSELISLIFLELNKAKFINCEYVNDFLLSDTIFLLGFFL